MDHHVYADNDLVGRAGNLWKLCVSNKPDQAFGFGLGCVCIQPTSQTKQAFGLGV